jgi:hypothetical protein
MRAWSGLAAGAPHSQYNRDGEHDNGHATESTSQVACLHGAAMSTAPAASRTMNTPTATLVDRKRACVAALS